MYCNKCGNEIPSGVSFCTHCGEKIDNSTSSPQQGNSTGNMVFSGTANASKDLFGKIAMGLLLLTGIVYLFTAVKYWGSNNDAFEWLSDGSHLFAIIFYWAIAIVMACDCCITGILNFIKKNKDGSVLIGTSISLFAAGVNFQQNI